MITSHTEARLAQREGLAEIDDWMGDYPDDEWLCAEDADWKHEDWLVARDALARFYARQGWGEAPRTHDLGEVEVLVFRDGGGITIPSPIPTVAEDAIHGLVRLVEAIR